MKDTPEPEPERTFGIRYFNPDGEAVYASSWGTKSIFIEQAEQFTEAEARLVMMGLRGQGFVSAEVIHFKEQIERIEVSYD